MLYHPAIEEYIQFEDYIQFTEAFNESKELAECSTTPLSRNIIIEDNINR